MAVTETTAAPATRAPAGKRSPTRIIAFVLGASLVLLVVVLAVASRGGDSGVEVETSGVQVRAITQAVTGSGKIRPEVEVPISSEVSGEVVFLGVQEGDRVREGQLLLRIRADFYTAQREQAEAGLLQAQAEESRARAELIRAESDVVRQRDLAGRGVVPASELEAAETRFEVAQANAQAAEYRVRSARASLSQAGDQLRRTTIYAPMSGTVSMLNVELGQRVVGTAQMTGTEIMRIAELDEMELEVDINENDVVNISLGDSARVEVDAYPEQPFFGVVTQIANSARISGAGTQDQVTSFPVKIKLSGGAEPTDTSSLAVADAPEQAPPMRLPLLRPGMSGTVDIYTATLDNAVVVPIQAVTVRDFNAVRRASGEEVDPLAREDLRRVVFVVNGDAVEMVEVETGISDDTHIAVLRGLNGAETVVTGPFRVLRTELSDGATVRVRETRTGTRS
jgi:HlyD family secretion protein